MCVVVGQLPSMPVSMCRNTLLFGQANTGFHLAKGTCASLLTSLNILPVKY